ncbi:MAG: domain S-box [Bryobacterales bacterium]|nr:domain S-box [Bryobacterales bacterium]
MTTRDIHEALQHSNGWFTSLLQGMPVGVVITGPDGDVTVCNPAALDLIGVTEEQLIGTTSLDPAWNAIHEDRSPFLGRDRPIPRAIATRQPVRNVVMGLYHIKIRDYVWFLINAGPQLAADGTVSHVVCCFTDITGRMRAEAVVTAWKNRYEAAISASGQVLYDWNATTKEAVWGGECKRILGYSPEQMAGIRWIELVHPDDKNAFSNEVDRVLATRDPFDLEYRVRTRSGRILYVKDRGRFYFDEGGKVLRMVGFVADITERKEAEEELRASEERFRNAFAFAATGMALTDFEGRFLEVNRAYCQITGYTETELATTDFRSITHREDLAKKMSEVRRLLAGEIPSFVIENRYVRKDGSMVWVRNSVSLLRDGKHEPARIILLDEDITERKHAEEALRQLSGRLLQLQDDERRRLARELHDTTAQSLTALGMNLETVNASACLLPEPARKILKDSLDLADQCIRELRTFSYLLHPPMLDHLGLSSAVAGYADGFAQRSGIKVTLDIASDLGRLSREVELMLFRIVQESLTNIHRHSGSRTAAIRIARHANEVLMEIKDHGHGISEGLTGAGGELAAVGVGIASMRERVRFMGGHLQVRSRSTGTDVEVIVPIPGTTPGCPPTSSLR